MAIVNVGASLDSGPLTPVAVFVDQIAAANFMNKYASQSSGITLSTVTTSNGNIGTFQGINPSFNANSGDEIKTTIAAVDGDSGGAATVVAGKNHTTYAVGILSSSDALGQNARFTTINDIAYYQASAALGQGIDPNQMPTDLILGASANEHIRGSVRKADIITNGDNNVILAGSGGGLIDTGLGQDNIVFLPAANGDTDAGTTVVLAPGKTTIVGGGANDRLVILADRMFSGAAGPTVSDTAATIQLKGAGGPAYDPNTPGMLYENNFSNASGYFFVDYNQVGSELSVTVRSDTADANSSAGWFGGVVIEGFHNGDFGITLGGDDTGEASAQDALSVNDDSSVDWSGQKSARADFDYTGRIITPLTSAQLSAALAAVIANTQGDGTTLVEPPPAVASGDQTFADSDITGSIGAGYVATVTGDNDAITAAGAGSTIDFGGTGETATISSGTVGLWDGASAAVSGNDNVITINADGVLSISGSRNTVDAAATGNIITASATTFNFWNGASGTVTGASNLINLNAGNALTVTGQTNRVTVASTGNSVSIGAGEVDLWDNAGASVSGDHNAIVLNSNDTLSAGGLGTSLTINGSGNSVTLTGQNATATVGSTGNSLSVSGAGVSFFDGSGGTVTGTADDLILYNTVNASVVGSGNTASIAGAGNTLSIAGGHVNLWDNAAATVDGNGNSFTLYDGTSLLAGGTGNTIDGAGTGMRISAASATVAFYNGAGGTVTGTHNELILNNDNHVTATGGSVSATIQGTGDTLAVGSAVIGLADRSSAAVTGNSNTFNFFGGSTLTASGTGETFVMPAHPLASTITGYDASDNFQFSQSTFANWQALLSHSTQSGANTVIHADANTSLTLTGVALNSLNANHFQFV